jgi:predicted nucleic acid-binding protein
MPPAEEFIVLDTSVILEIWGTSGSQYDKQECKNFIINTAKANNIICITTKTYEELNIKSESNVIPREKYAFNKDKQLFLSQSATQMQKIVAALNNLPNFFPDPIGSIDCNSIKEIEKNRVLHNLRWGDSAIYTLAKQEGINNICTLDGDWLGIKDGSTTIYTSQNRFNQISSLSNNINTKP